MILLFPVGLGMLASISVVLGDFAEQWQKNRSFINLRSIIHSSPMFRPFFIFAVFFSLSSTRHDLLDSKFEECSSSPPCGDMKVAAKTFQLHLKIVPKSPTTQCND